MITLMYDDYDSKKNPADQIQERLDMIKQLPGKLSEISEMKEMGSAAESAGVSDCPECGSLMWNGQCENTDCEYHWYPMQDEEEEERRF